MQLVHNTALKILHATILELVCPSLDPELSNFLRVCSNLLLMSSVQLLHPNCGCNTFQQSTGSTTRVTRQIDPLSQLSVNSIGDSKSHFEVFGHANLAGCIPTRESTIGGVVLWSGQFVKTWSKNDGNYCPEWWRNLTGSSCQGSNSRCGTAVISARHWLVSPRGNQIRCKYCDRDGSSTRVRKKFEEICGFRIAFVRENSRLQNVRVGESD